MNTLNIFDLQIPISIEKEISENLVSVDKRLNQLNSDNELIKKFESSLGANISIESMIENLRQYEECEKKEKNLKNINDCIQLFIDCDDIDKFIEKVLFIKIDWNS